MKHRISHSAFLLCAMLLITALLAGISPASYAAPIQRDAFAHMDRTLPVGGTADEKAPAPVEDGVPVDAADADAGEKPLNERLLKDELLKEETAEAAAEEALPEEVVTEPVSEDALPEDAVTEPAEEETLPEQDDTLVTGTVSIEDILKANDYYLLMDQFGGYGILTNVEPEFSWGFENNLCYVTDSQVYFEYPPVKENEIACFYDDFYACDDPSAGNDNYWDGFDWNRFDWDNFDWENFDWKNYDWRGFLHGVLNAEAAEHGDDLNRDDDIVTVGEMFWEDPTTAILFTAKNRYEMNWYSQENSDFSIDWYAYPGEETDIDLWTIAPQLNLGYLEITDVRMEDGLLVVTMLADEENLPLEIRFEGLQGGQRRETYYLDADTGLIQNIAIDEVYPDGKELPLYTQTFFYEAPDSEVYDAMTRKAAAYEREEFENPRTVTVIYDPGTELEETCTRTAEKGDLLYTYFLDGYLMFEDAEGTMPFNGSDGLHDVTIYGIYEDDMDWGWGPWIMEDDTVLYDAPFDVNAGEDTQDAVVPDEAAQAPAAEEEVIPKPVFKYEDDFAAAPDEAAEAPAAEEEIIPKPVFKYENEDACIGNPADQEPDTVIVLPEQDDSAVYYGEFSSELDFAETSHALYEANTLDAIFSRHDSVEYWILFDEDKLPSTYYDYVYETPDTAYSETKDAAFYADRDSFYQMWIDGSYSDLYYTFDFRNGYDPHLNAGYQLVPADEEEWWNPANEKPVDSYAASGEVCLISEYDEELSRRFVEERLLETYEGQSVTVTVIADAESYEIISLCYEMTDTDGNVSYPMTFLAE